MNRLPQLFRLQAALEVLSRQTDVLPAVGGATEEELHPDIDEIEDGKITKDDTLLDEPFEFGQSDTYVPLQPLKRTEDHLFRYFQDGSMRSFFAGTALEHDRQTPVIIGQVGCAALEREDNGRLKIAVHRQRNLLLVAFSQISQPVRDKLQEIVANLGPDYELADIEAHGQATQDLRRRADDSMRQAMILAEAEAMVAVLESKPAGWLVSDGSIRFAKFFEELGRIYGTEQPRVVSVAKNFSKTPRFKLGRGGKNREVNLWQLLADLPEGNRTLAWKACTRDRTVAVWYLRLRLRRYMDYPLMGVIKVELPVLGPDPPTSELVTKLSNALLAERTVTPHGMDRRWHAHLYPVFQAERCVKNSFVSVSTLRAGLHWPPAQPARRTP
mgnify:CR=1 FL=1